MSRYIVRVIGPAGRETYLSRGREVERDNATRYAHPSAAYRSAERYYNKKPGTQFVVDVIDTRDPERVVEG